MMQRGATVPESVTRDCVKLHPPVPRSFKCTLIQWTLLSSLTSFYVLHTHSLSLSHLLLNKIHTIGFGIVCILIQAEASLSTLGRPRKCSCWRNPHCTYGYVFLITKPPFCPAREGRRVLVHPVFMWVLCGYICVYIYMYVDRYV